MGDSMERVEGRVYRTIYGGHTENVCAWCGFHKGCLTVKHLKKHKCLKKNCNALVRYDDHPYWEERKIKKINKKEKKLNEPAY